MDIAKEIKRKTQDVLIDIVKKTRRILIGDTTLRDGEQAPRAGLNAEEKLTIAGQLDRLGVDSIEAGFPAANKEDFEAVRLVSRKIRRPLISALARCHAKDIELAHESLKDAREGGIILFLGTSPVLRKYSLNKSREEVIETLKRAVTLARKFADNVAFGAEDASRTEPDFLYEVYEKAIDSGASLIGFTDTVGWLVPEETKGIMDGIKRNVRNLKKVLLGVHFHNDLGLALANSLVAVECGANIVQCTINGLGERAGNTSLEELVMALKTRKEYYKTTVNINTKELFKTSRLVERLTGIGVSPQKPIVGGSVFATEAGIHQAALLKQRLTYEIIKPEAVGQRGTTFVLGRHSGKHAVYDRMRKLGYRVNEKRDRERLEAVYRRFKEVASTRKEVDDGELADIARVIFRIKK